jgi:hypothetical protein
MPPIFALIALISAVALLIITLARRQILDDVPVLEFILIGDVIGFSVVALLVESILEGNGNVNLTEYITSATGFLLIVGGIFRTSSHKSRAFLRVMGGFALIALTVAIPVITTRLNLPNQLEALPTPQAPQTSQDVAANVYQNVLGIIAQETGYDSATISQQLDSGSASVADLVRETNGNLERVIQGITTVMNDAIGGLVLQGSMDENQAAFVISAMETVVRAGVEFDLTNLMSRFTEVTLTD